MARRDEGEGCPVTEEQTAEAGIHRSNYARNLRRPVLALLLTLRVMVQVCLDE
jgi:hypothetical protein